MQIEFALTPKQRDFQESAEKYMYTLYGGAKGGGKSRGLREIMLIRRFQYPGSYGYLFRKTYPELKRNHIDKILKEHPELDQYYHRTDRAMYLPNKSVLYFCYADNYDELEKFQGQEIHDLGVEEAGEWHADWIQELILSVRSAEPDIPVSVLLTANPGGISHKWLKRLFVDKDYEEGVERAGDYNFIQAKIGDNPALVSADPSYKWRLMSNIKDKMTRRALVDGDWNISAGQFFDSFRRSIHVVEPFTIPNHWSWAWSYDYGFNHPFSFGVWRIDEDGNEYRVAEVSESHRQIREQAELIKDCAKRKSISPVIAGLDCFHKIKARDMGGKSITEEFAKYGIYLTKAKVDRKQGATQVREGLHYYYEERENGEQVRIGPNTFFFDTCKIGIDHIERMTHNPKDLEDVLKIDSTNGDPMTGDDAYDEIRYFRMSRPSRAVLPREPDRKSYDYGKKEIKDSWQTI